MTRRSLAVVSAGLSQPSSTRLLADQLTTATVEHLTAAGTTTDVTVIELRELAHDITNRLLTGFAAPALQQALDTVAGADGLIAVTPLYSASYSGLYKSFFDVLDPEAIEGTPVVIAATGGTERHSLALDHALRPLFTYLRAAVMPTAVFAASSDWGSGRAALSSLADRVERAGGELVQAMNSRQGQRAVDPYVAATPFVQLLGR